jgi:oligoendopeptidase F
VAFTDFGEPPRRRGRSWSRGEFWTFATYGAGGFGNLEELLHETGHGIHIAAIRTRPAFATWPDSTPFTEALADLTALEAYEPEWQRKHLGAEAALADSIRSKYRGIVLDVAWALFEVRMHREPGADPNQVWTSLTRDYLRIAPHPELSWWAMRGQLVDEPGYMTNYAVGAILAADLRARCAEKRGPLWTGDPGYYAWLSGNLYRFGLERPSRDVILGFLGRATSPAALLADLARMRPRR